MCIQINDINASDKHQVSTNSDDKLHMHIMTLHVASERIKGFESSSIQYSEPDVWVRV